MDHGTKQRVVGTIVLFMLALIFLPFILDGGGNYQPAISSRIPPTPGVQPMPEPVPQRPVIEADRYPVPDPQPDYQVLDLEDSESQTESVQPIAEVAPASAGPDTAAPPAIDTGTSVATIEESVTEVSPALDERSLPSGWSVRLGVFSNPRNATNLEARLLDAGYRAYTRQISGSQGVVTGVFVGPQVERADANRLKAQLQEEFDLAGLVVRFQVESI